MLVICSDHHLLVNTLKIFCMAQVFLLTPSARNWHGSRMHEISHIYSQRISVQTSRTLYTNTLPYMVLCPGSHAVIPIYCEVIPDLAVSKNSATPKWMVKIMENPINPWDDLGGTTYHHLRKPPTWCHVVLRSWNFEKFLYGTALSVHLSWSLREGRPKIFGKISVEICK